MRRTLPVLRFGARLGELFAAPPLAMKALLDLDMTTQPAMAVATAPRQHAPEKAAIILSHDAFPGFNF